MLGHQCKIDSDSPSTTNCSTVVLKDLKHSFSDLGHNFLAFASYSEKRRVGRPLSEAAGNEAHKLGNDDPFLYYSLFLISFRTVLSVHSYLGNFLLGLSEWSSNFKGAASLRSTFLKFMRKRSHLNVKCEKT